MVSGRSANLPRPPAVVHSLIQAVLGSPNFDFYDSDAASYPFGIILYYAWSIATIVILLNVLVALFSSACACSLRFLRGVLSDDRGPGFHRRGMRRCVETFHLILAESADLPLSRR